jgi:UDP-N-acetylmuramoyl-tripeptide--D-alanyl-D-alanine ligase
MPVRQVAASLGLSVDSATPVAGYEVDSRRVQPGDLFFALPGEKVDGHRFLADVRARGGIGAVVSKSYSGEDFGLELLRVEDVTLALHHLARTAAAETQAKIVAITGSVGKTTTKEFVATLLGGKFRVGKNQASFNTRLTLPTTILNMRGDEEVWVLEMGMSEPGDIQTLVNIAPPDIGVLTKIALAHAAFFPGGLSQIASGKAEIFHHPKTKKAIFDWDLSEYPEVLASISSERFSFSLHEKKADYFLTDGVVDEKGVRAHRIEIPFKEAHIQHNMLAAICVARALKLEWEEIDRRIPLLELPKMRFEQFEKEGILFINDAYNANPASMKAALSSLPEPKAGGKRIAVLGTMYPLGSFSKEAHEEIGRFAQGRIDHLLVVGEEAKPLCEAFGEVKKPAEYFGNDKKALVSRLKELMHPGDVVVVKASRVMQMEQIFTLLD